jgi:hypothetical protein
MDEMKPVIVNGIDITKVEGADLKTKSDKWYHTTELEMIGDNDESTTEHLIDFLKKQKYDLPTLNINQLLKDNKK